MSSKTFLNKVISGLVCSLIFIHGSCPQVKTGVLVKQNSWSYLFIYLFGLGLHLRSMEISRPVVESELQQPAYATATATPDLSQSAVCTIAGGNAGSLTYLVRPGIEPASLRTLCQVLNLLSRNGNFRSWSCLDRNYSFCVRNRIICSGKLRG